MRGFMSTKGNPHYDRAARIMLKDYVKVSYYSLCPLPASIMVILLLIKITRSRTSAIQNVSDNLKIPLYIL